MSPDLIVETRVIEPLPADAAPVTEPPKATKTGSARIELIDACSLKPEAVSWLWPGWLARGKLHVLAGAPGTGKTTLAMNWAAAVSAGLPFPSGHLAPQGRVLIWSGEDDPADTLLPRLIAAGADLSMIQFVGDRIGDGGRSGFDPASDVPLLIKAAGADVAMIIVDPLVSAVAGDSHKNAEVRRSLAPLVEFASKLDAVLLGITHYSKGTQGREPLERVSGSLAFGALARLVFGTVRDATEEENAPSKMKLARAKSNIGPDGGGFSYSFEQIELVDYANINASRIVWGSAIEGSARDLLADEQHIDRQADDAAHFLHELLSAGPMSANDVYRDAKTAGFSIDQMKRAKRKAGAESGKGGMRGGWMWRLTREGSM